VREAIAAGKASTVILSEGLKGWRVLLKCQCRKEEERTVQDIEAFEKRQQSCQCGARPEVVWKKELVEELAEKAEQTDARVEMISTETPEGQQFLIGFGGIGAFLRYK
jgi:peptide chain release factor subunit 1